jgi:hypothetical protein
MAIVANSGLALPARSVTTGRTPIVIEPPFRYVSVALGTMTHFG